MAGRRNFRKGGKSAYKLTSRRKAALRKAQLASARKRRKNKLKTIGVVGAVGAGIAVYGYKKGAYTDIASDLKNRDFRFTNSRNALAGKITPKMKEQQMTQSAVSPATQAAQAPPIKSPDAVAGFGGAAGGSSSGDSGKPAGSAKSGFGGAVGSATSNTPRPNNNTSKENAPQPSGTARNGFGGATSSPTAPGKAGSTPKVQHLPQAPSIIDPTPPAKAVFPAEHLPKKDSILSKIGTTETEFMALDPQARRDLAMDLAKMWDHDYIRAKGVKTPGFGGRKRELAIYGGILNMFGTETKAEEKRRLGTTPKKARSRRQ